MANIRKGIVFNGDKGQLEIDIEKELVKFNGLVEASFAEDDSYLAILKEFLSAIEGKRPSQTAVEEGYKALEIIDRAYKAAAS